jgi:hypothetical protein
MIRRILAALLFGMGLAPSALAHGGGAVVVPIYGPGAVPDAQTGDYSGIHSIAIISGVAQNLTLQKARLLAPEEKSLDVSAWKLDAQIETEAARYLGGKYSVKNITADRAALAGIPNGAWDYSAPALRKYLRTLPVDGIDAFVILRPDHEDETPGLAGLALDMGADILMRDLRPVAWANYEIDVIDARSLRFLGKAYSRMRLRSGDASKFVGLICDESVRPADGLLLNERQLDLLRNLYGNMLNVSLLETLRALDLGVALPGVGARTLAAIPEGKDPYPKIKIVAIVSALGRRLNFDHMGDLAFIQTHEPQDLPEWGFDQLVQDSLRAAVSNRFTVKDVAFDRNTIVSDQLEDPNGEFKPQFPGLQPSQDVDAYIVVVPLPVQIWNFGRLRGLGVVNSNPIIGKATAVYADYAIAVLDAHTLKLITAHAGTVGPDYPNPNPLLAIDMGLWPDHPASASAAQLDGIRKSLTKLLKDSISETALRMGLTGMMISTDPTTTQAASVASH